MTARSALPQKMAEQANLKMPDLIQRLQVFLGCSVLKGYQRLQHAPSCSSVAPEGAQCLLHFAQGVFTFLLALISQVGATAEFCHNMSPTLMLGLHPRHSHGHIRAQYSATRASVL